MATKEELKKLIGKKCFYYKNTLEILGELEPADSLIIDVEEKGFTEIYLVIQNRHLGKTFRIPDYEIKKVVRKD